MSSYKVISKVSTKLREILWEAFQDDVEFKNAVGINSENEIVFKNPTETAQNSTYKLSLWLYQITENEFVKNQPMVRAQSNGQAQMRFPPLALNLFYLVTPFASSSEDNGESDHLLIGKTMEVLYDNANILLKNEDEAVAEELHVIFRRLSLEELTRIWEALQEPYRLSVCYEVRVTRIDSQRERTHERVIARIANRTEG